MRLLFLTDNFPPETNAPATRTFEHCREWVKKGIDVTVITSVPNFPFGKTYKGYKNKLFQKEQISGIKVIRVWTYMAKNAGFFLRIIDFLSYAKMSFLVGIFIRTDLIIATSPQFFTALSGCFLSFFKRVPWVMEIRDLWPESIVSVGSLSKTSLVYKILEKIEVFLYKRCKKIIVVTDSFKKQLINRNICQEKIMVFKNGVLAENFIKKKKDKGIIKKYGLEKKFVVGYIGTLGMAHGLDFILECAKEITDNTVFLFIGDGAEKEKLKQQKRKGKIKKVLFLPSILKEEVPKYLSVLDVALVNLKKTNTFKTVIPSKIFENTAMEKPILLGVDGEARKIIEQYHCGLYFDPENKKDFFKQLERIKKEEVRNKLKNNCKNLVADFDRRKIAGEMIDFLQLCLKKK